MSELDAELIREKFEEYACSRGWRLNTLRGEYEDIAAFIGWKVWRAAYEAGRRATEVLPEKAAPLHANASDVEATGWDYCIEGLREAAKLQCTFCREGRIFDAIQKAHPVGVCKCGHGETYHRPFCHGNCQCLEFRKVAGKSAIVLCNASVINSKISDLESGSGVREKEQK